MAGNHQCFPGDTIGMIQALNNGIESPGTNNIVSLWTQIGWEMLRKPGGIRGPASNNKRRTRGGGPGIHNILLWSEISGPTSTWLVGSGNARINGQLFHASKLYLTASTTRPSRKRNAHKTLTRDTPVPLQMLNPMFIATAHILWPPLNLATRLNKTLLLIENANKPLARMLILNRRTTPLMQANVMFNGLLIQDASLSSQ